MAAHVHHVGILNITPDSFSDGGQYDSVDAAINHAHFLFSSGAEWVDIGADSTRPGSLCIGDEEEWIRLEPVLCRIAKTSRVSVDTHSSVTARRAIQLGAGMINDISGGSHEMFELIADTEAFLVSMYSRCPSPHNFDFIDSQSIFDDIRRFFDEKIQIAEQVGLPMKRMIFDPGMGSFVGKSPESSFLLLKHFNQLSSYERLYLGVSRKGFLKKPLDKIASCPSFSLDMLSAQKAFEVVEQLSSSIHLYVRSHSIEPLIELLHGKSLPAGQCLGSNGSKKTST